MTSLLASVYISSAGNAHYVINPPCNNQSCDVMAGLYFILCVCVCVCLPLTDWEPLGVSMLDRTHFPLHNMVQLTN